jgi:hypothetical protein
MLSIYDRAIWVYFTGAYSFTAFHRTGGISSVFCHGISREKAKRLIIILNVFTGSMLAMSYGLGGPD